MLDPIGEVLTFLIGSREGLVPIAGLHAANQFDPQDKSPPGLHRNLNAAFLLALAGKEHSARASDYLSAMLKDEKASELAAFLNNGLRSLKKELLAAIREEPELERKFNDAVERLKDLPEEHAYQATWEIFFPEGLSALCGREAAVAKLRERRTVQILHVNPSPVTDPTTEVLFTSNILLGKPTGGRELDNACLSRELAEQIKNWQPDEQLYWYDHPVPLGVAPEKNEILHGLRGLSEAVDFERLRRSGAVNKRVNCLCSVSVTHASLHDLARPWIKQTVDNVGGFESLDVYVVTERDTDRLKNEMLFPAAEHYFPGADLDSLDEVMGVDGEYGRHFSFLKAVAAFWQVFIDSGIKGTFKFDLDQVFPQPELVEQAGGSAFELLSDPLWGAVGVDHWGQEVELGMVAGAVVNRDDIHRGIFTPDVLWPPLPPKADQCVFYSTLPQALSTEAELMTRYGVDGLDGKSACIQRIHVLGGMSGILVNSLRRYRPFTPTFIGRAEDQAFMLGTLFSQRPWLRCLHKPGLMMRHDKYALIPGTIAVSQVSKTLGDYLRILVYTDYCNSLPWPVQSTKEVVDPFTGCFVSLLPLHLVFLRLALKAADLFDSARPEDIGQACRFLEEGASRLGGYLAQRSDGKKPLSESLASQRRGWDLYYDLLERLEDGLARGEAFETNLKRKAVDFAASIKI